MNLPSILRVMTLCVVATLSGILGSQAAVSPAQFPTIYINTTDNTPVTSKDTYLTATYWLDPKGDSSVKAIGSEASPLSLQIKGRGNYTWTGFDKKPYRLKLDKKAALMGMTSSKHFALLANADDCYAFLRNTMGFELSRRLDLPWTPTATPVQLVLNGDFKGLYFLTETIRVDADRVSITDQADNATDPDAITGGWLVEIDNYDTDPHISITEGNGKKIIFTYKTPEVLSTEQTAYLTAQMTAINKAIYATDKTSTDWENLVDIDALARYYIVQEILDDCESFHGSCYLYRDRGADSKWTFGPVWDFGNAFARTTKKFIFDDPAFNQTWIGEIYKFPRFQAHVKELWADFVEHDYDSLTDYIDEFVAHIADASTADLQRWPSYGQSDLTARASNFKSLLRKSATFLDRQWGDGNLPTHEDIYLRGTFNSWGVTHPMTYNANGTYSLANITLSGEFKIATSDWHTVDLGSNGEKIRLDTPYKLTASGPNITCSASIKNATFVYNPADSTLTISTNTAVDDIIADADDMPTVCGRTVTAANPFSVYTLAGIPISRDVTSATLPAPGTYIVATPTRATKIAVR